MTPDEPLTLEVNRRARPSLGLASWRRFTIELLQFRRSREAVFFTIGFPLVMLALFGTIFGGQDLGPKTSGVTFAQYFIASMMAAGVWGSCFTNLAISVPSERDSGALKRLAGTPMPMTAYFAGKIGLVLLLSAIETVLLLTMGLAFYHLRLPPPGKWLTFAWVMILASSCTCSAWPCRAGPNARTLGGRDPLAILLQFISGVYFVFDHSPAGYRTSPRCFPCDGSLSACGRCSSRIRSRPRSPAAAGRPARRRS